MLPKIVIVGAGISGCVASGYFSSLKPVVYEALSRDKSMLHTHKAVMRIRDPRIGMILGADLKEISVIKQCYYNGKLHSESDITMRNLYSIKVNGVIQSKSIENLGVVNRYLLGEYDINGVYFEHSVEAFRINKKGKFIEFLDDEGHPNTFSYDVCISTIPMFVLLKILGIKTDVIFPYTPIWVVRIPLAIPSDVHQTIYFPSEYLRTYRATLEGDIFILESIDGEPDDSEINEIIKIFGLSEEHIGEKKKYTMAMGKILPIDDNFRRMLILELTEKYGIYSLGRFATWSPVRIDNLVDDLDKIKRMIGMSEERKKYERRLFKEGA